VSDVPVIVTTDDREESCMVQALDTGADDYVVEPISVTELEARLRAVLRRAAGPTDRPIVVGGLRIDVAAREATLDGVQLDLTRKEFDLLAHLAADAGRVVPRRELLASVWHQPYGGPDKTIDVHVSWLRRKLGETGAAPRYLETVRGVGVRLVVPATS